jgi:peptidyl-prolyl cis-trans isomerase C
MTISRGFFRSVGLGPLFALALAAAATPAPAQDAAAQDKVLATVNGVAIKESDLVLAEQDVGSQLQSVPEAARRDYLIRFMADLILGAQAAETERLQDSPDFAQRMQYFRNKILLDDLMVKEAAKADTPEARKKLYDDTVAKLPPEIELHARHVLVDDEAKAKEVAERARKGEDFVALSKEFSKDPGSASEGGDLGWFTKDKMVKEFSEAAFKLEPGEISDPVKSQFGWHVIKVEGKRTKPVPPFDEVKDQIGNYLVQKAQQAFLLSLREKAKIVSLEKPVAPPPGEAPAPAQPAAPKP